MKSRKLLAGIIVLLFITSASSTIGFTPEDEGFVEVLLMSGKQNKIYLNSLVNFYLIIKNLTNDTINNITITQVLPGNADLVSIFDETFTDELSLKDVTLQDEHSNKALSFTYLNATKMNFTANIDINLTTDDYFVINFEVNLTTTGSFEFLQPNFSYYDHWGDEYTDFHGQGTSIQVSEEPFDERRIYFPGFSVEEPDYLLMVILLLSVAVVAIIGRVLYGKKPIEL